MSRKRVRGSMTPQLEIYVDGTGSVFRKAERAYVRLTVSLTSTDQSEAFQEVQTTVSALTANIRSLATKTEDDRPHPSAAVTAFTVTPLSTTSVYQRDKNYKELRKLPKECTVSASAEIIFRDMVQLAETSAELATMPHVSVSGTEWRLTEATREEIEREARLKAIKDAVQKAQDYAGVVGRRVVAVEIRDGPSSPGYAMHRPLPQARNLMVQQQQQMAQQMPGGSGMAVASEGPALEPKTITVSAYVNAKFMSNDGDDEDYMEVVV
ncbi:hypothetical protein CONLIGDRAFT_78941 [Coniochaeta ligniaria NRRL 30616]|uniref:DUF541 domain-containing protein n=1 Tax=Coniochaeta ligniaria NRRL 30616 TaxID=1408157 RepID=A0A1J7IVA3_9PEZI|nr:hypothetical protein CONLIGDRAFT_78941 [Coniochaeta ligniaria NRRL 30616]